MFTLFSDKRPFRVCQACFSPYSADKYHQQSQTDRQQLLSSVVCLCTVAGLQTPCLWTLAYRFCRLSFQCERTRRQPKESFSAKNFSLFSDQCLRCVTRMPGCLCHCILSSAFAWLVPGKVTCFEATTKNR